MTSWRERALVSLLLLALSSYIVDPAHALQIGVSCRGRRACDSRIRRLYAVDDVEDAVTTTQDIDATEPESLASGVGLGPFASTLGKWDASAGEPDFLQEMDWHPASRMSAAERAAAEAVLLEEEEEEGQTAAFLEQTGDSDQIALASETYVEPAYEYIKYCEDFEIPEVHPSPKTRMPASWQEFQFLQEQVANFLDAPEIEEKQRADARKHAEELSKLYPTFKDVLAYGWTLDFHPVVDAAGIFVAEMRQKARQMDE